MKKVIFLAGSLLLSSISIAQTYSAPASAGDNGTTNVYLGEEAGMSSLDTIEHNTFIGCRAGKFNIIGSKNTFIGFRSGYENTNGTHNTFLGYRSGYYNTTGNYNVYLGVGSGLNNIDGYYNVFLGPLAGRDETGSNKLYISNSQTSSPLVYGDFSSKQLKFNANKVGIGSNFDSFPMLSFDNAASYRLFVRGGILAEEVRVRLQADWADYVFSDDYKLPSLKETEAFINENRHLPNMPSATQVKEEGIEMGNIIKLQQEKIEELTLYAINQEKRLENQEKEIELLKSQMAILLSKK